MTERQLRIICYFLWAMKPSPIPFSKFFLIVERIVDNVDSVQREAAGEGDPGNG